jgi:hypothetical protein
MVPPTFTEVGELMLKRIFENFKHDRNNDAKPIITQHQSLELAKDYKNCIRTILQINL